jgi:PRC-barrel domain
MNDQSFSTNTLVSSANVDGTDVYGRDGSIVGTIDHLMIDKASGKVAYAMMRFGGFLGFGTVLYPVPWNSLSYDTAKGGFVTNITENQLEDAPLRPERWEADRDWEQRTHDYWGLPYYWM